MHTLAQNSTLNSRLYLVRSIFYYNLLTPLADASLASTCCRVNNITVPYYAAIIHTAIFRTPNIFTELFDFCWLMLSFFVFKSTWAFIWGRLYHDYYYYLFITIFLYDYLFITIFLYYIFSLITNVFCCLFWTVGQLSRRVTAQQTVAIAW